jgi:alpha-D-xyloside xylohydrolase
MRQDSHASSLIVVALAGLCCTSSPRTSSQGSISVRDTDASLAIASMESSVVVTKRPFGVAVMPVQGVSVEEPPSALAYVAGGSRVALDRLTGWTFGDKSVRLEAVCGSLSCAVDVSFPRDGVVRLSLTPPREAKAEAANVRLISPAGEHIYGLLERTVDDLVMSELAPVEVGGLDRRGTTVKMEVFHTFGLYTPFFQTSRGYGLYIEGTTIGRYDLAAADPEVIDLQFELPPGVTSLSYLVIGGPEHDQILDRYTDLVGRPFVPPEWAFKHWRWRDEHRVGTPAMVDGVMVNADLADDLLHYERLGIPVGNYTIDRPWAGGDLPDLTEPEAPGFGDLFFDDARFPNAQKMVDLMKQRGYHVFLWVAPWATGLTTNKEARDNGYLAPGSRFIIDFTNPRAVDWWTKKITPLVEMGFSGFKLDRGDEDTPTSVGKVFADGRTGRELRNAYPEIEAHVHHDIMKAVRGDDFLVYPRTGYAGSQRWVVFSMGDVPGTDMTGTPTDLGLRAAKLALLHNAFNGFPIWGSDTGGYAEFKNREVFARWLEFSAFCPIMEIGGIGEHAPWRMPTDPSFDEEMIDIYREYTTMHHALAPYSYQNAREAGRSGRPIAKPLVFNYADDPKVADMWEEYLYGDDILVAPVWKVGQRTAHVYLPAGSWIDHWDKSRVIQGPKELDEPAPLDRFPIFVRQGSDIVDKF